MAVARTVSRPVENTRQPARATARAVMTGLVCAAFLSVATAYTDGFLVGSELGGCHFPLGPVFLLNS